MLPNRYINVYQISIPFTHKNKSFKFRTLTRIQWNNLLLRHISSNTDDKTHRCHLTFVFGIRLNIVDDDDDKKKTNLKNNNYKFVFIAVKTLNGNIEMSNNLISAKQHFVSPTLASSLYIFVKQIYCNVFSSRYFLAKNNNVIR